MPAPAPILPDPLRALMGANAPQKRPRPRGITPPWLQNLYGAAMSGPQRRATMLPQLGQDLAALLGARAAAQAPISPLLNLLLRR